MLPSFALADPVSGSRPPNVDDGVEAALADDALWSFQDWVVKSGVVGLLHLDTWVSQKDLDTAGGEVALLGLERELEKGVERAKMEMDAETLNSTTFPSYTQPDPSSLRRWLLSLTRDEEKMVPLSPATPAITLEWDVPTMAPETMRILDSRVVRRPADYPFPRGWNQTLDETHQALQSWVPLALTDGVKPLYQGRVPLGNFREGEPATTFGVHYGRAHPTTCNPEVPGFSMSHEGWINVQKWCGNPCCSGGTLSRPATPTVFVDAILINGLGVSYPSATGHFVVQSLPRILRTLAFVPASLRPHVKILMGQSRVVEVMIDRLVDLRILSRDDVIFTDRVMYAAPLMLFTDGPLHLGDNMEFVTRVLKMGLEPDDPSQIVFLRRVHSRTLTDHSAVYNALTAAFPSETIVDFRPENVDFYEMIEILRKATMFLAPHGAGLYHTHFAPPCTPILEFGIYASMYYHLAVNSGRPYWIITSMDPSLEEVIQVVRDMAAWRSSSAYSQCLKDHYQTWEDSLRTAWAALGPISLNTTNEASFLLPSTPPPSLQRIIDGELPPPLPPINLSQPVTPVSNSSTSPASNSSQ